METSAVAKSRGVRVVDVRVSADAEQVPLLRSFAADVAMRLDFDLDAIEDVRMAVDEACSLLVRMAGPGASLYCAFEPEEPRIRIRAEVETDQPSVPSADPMGWQILTALSERVTEQVISTPTGHRVCIELLAGRGEADPR